MIDPELLAGGFEANMRVITRLTQGLSQADSLLVPSFGGNCMNWVLGHVTSTRNHVLALLDQEPVWDEETATRYRTGADPITGECAGAVPLERMLADLADSTARIASALRARTADDMAANRQEAAIGQSLLGLYWHEAYHIGQLELFRRLAGRTEKVFG
jgi:hypothetical protein